MNQKWTEWADCSHSKRFWLALIAIAMAAKGDDDLLAQWLAQRDEMASRVSAERDKALQDWLKSRKTEKLPTVESHIARQRGLSIGRGAQRRRARRKAAAKRKDT